MDNDLREILERIDERVEHTVHQLTQIDERLPVGLEPVSMVMGDRTIVLEQHNGAAVWVDAEAEAIREESTLCSRCALFIPQDGTKNCGIAQSMAVVCVSADVAITLTRCKHFMLREQREYRHKPDEQPSAGSDDVDTALDAWSNEGGSHE